jgi:mRNA interferase MazF
VSLAFGDVVLVPFPFTSQAASKQRPAVVVSSRAYAVERPDVVMMAITSQLRPAPTPTGVNWGEVWLADWQGAGLLKPSANLFSQPSNSALSSAAWHPQQRR